MRKINDYHAFLLFLAVFFIVGHVANVVLEALK